MSDRTLTSFKSATVSYDYDIGSIQTLKGISWVGEGVVKVRYRIANTDSELSRTPFWNTDIERFSIGSSLSSKFEITRDDIGLYQTNALVVSGNVSSLGKNLDYLADAYGAEITALDVTDESFSLSALLQLEALPLNSRGGRAYLGIRNDTNEIFVQKRIEQLSLPVIDGYQEVFTDAIVEVEGYGVQYNIRTTPAEVRLTEISETKTFDKSQLIIVDEVITRNESDIFVTANSVSGLIDAYGDGYSTTYNLISGNGETFLTKDVITDKVNILNGRIQTLNYEPITDSWIAADVNHKWTTNISLNRGRYYYNFIVTTRRASGVEEVIKTQDPKNSQTYTNDFGETFSVVDVTDATASVTFSLCTSAIKVSVVGSFNDFIPDTNQLQIGSDLDQVKRMLLNDGLYTNGWKDWNRVDIYLDEPTLVERIRFETEVAEEERQKVLILLDDKPVTKNEYNYASGRDLSTFSSLPIPKKPEAFPGLQLTVLNEFDIGFDDKEDGYGYLDVSGKVIENALLTVLVENDDAYGMSNEKKYEEWRRQSITSFSTDESDAFNTVRKVVESFDLTSSDSQIILREEPENNVKIIRLDSFTTNVQFKIVGFNTSNRTLEVSPALTRGVYEINYYSVIYGGKLINATTLQDAQGNRYKYITGVPTTGATVAITDIITIESDNRNDFQLSHYPSSYTEITITTLGSYSRELSVGMTVASSTITLNSYLSAGTYVLFYTNEASTEKVEVFILDNVFNTLTTIDLNPSLLSLFKVENEVEELYITGISGRTVLFNAPNQAGLFEVRYDVRELTSTIGDALWISIEDGYGEWKFIDGYGNMDGYGTDAYGSTRQTIQKVSLLTRLESHSGNPRKHKNFEVYAKDISTQTITEFSLKIDKPFEPYLTVHSLLTPQSTTSTFPSRKEYITVANADGTWELPVELYEQRNKISVISTYFDENGNTISSANITRPTELFENQDSSIVEVTLPSPYVEPFKEVTPTYETQLTVSYGTDQYFSANINEVTAAKDGYGELLVIRKSDDIWLLQREGVTDYIIDRRALSVSAVVESKLASGTLTVTYTETPKSIETPYSGLTVMPSELATFTVGQIVKLQVLDIAELVRVKDLSIIQITFFYNQQYLLPDFVNVMLNDRLDRVFTLQIDSEQDAYGNTLDRYGVMVTYSADFSEALSSLSINSLEVLQKFTVFFNATSEQMMLGQMSLKVKDQNINSACEVIVNGEVRYRSVDPVVVSNLDPYNLTMHGSQFVVRRGTDTVYVGEFNDIGNTPKAILGASPREFGQNIVAKLGGYELCRYITVPQNVNAIGRYVEIEMTIDDYDNTDSKYESVMPVIEYEQPVFPPRPKIVDI